MFDAGLDGIVEYARFDVLRHQIELVQNVQAESLVFGADVRIADDGLLSQRQKRRREDSST